VAAEKNAEDTDEKGEEIFKTPVQKKRYKRTAEEVVKTEKKRTPRERPEQPTPAPARRRNASHYRGKRKRGLTGWLQAHLS